MNKQSEKLKVKGEELKTNNNVGAEVAPCTEKGITLVALVITIIVLIILAGVSINAVMNQGLITNAKDASNQYEKSKTKEEINIGKLVQEVENAQGSWVQNGTIITNKNDSTVSLNVGDYVAYEPQTEITTYEISNEYSSYGKESKIYNKDTLTWRVLGVNEYGRLELISADTTSEIVKLRKYQGYNNGVYLINDMCNKLYGNPDNGTSARGVNIKDIQDVMNLEVWDYHDYGNDFGYENRVEMTNVQVPAILALEKGQTVSGVDGNRYSESQQDELISQTAEEWEQTKDITVTQNYWSASLSASNFKKEIYYELFINNGEKYYYYTVASRIIDCYSDADGNAVGADLGLGRVAGGYIGGGLLCDPGDGSSVGSTNDYLRPIVTLGSSITVDTTVEGKDGTTVEKAWVLK